MGAAKMAALGAVGTGIELGVTYAMARKAGREGLTGTDLKNAALDAGLRVADRAIKGKTVSAPDVIDAGRKAMKKQIRNLKPTKAGDTRSEAGKKTAKSVLKSAAAFRRAAMEMARDRREQMYGKAFRAYGSGSSKKGKKKSGKKGKKGKKKPAKKGKKGKKKPAKKKKKKSTKGRPKKMNVKKAFGKYKKMTDVFASM